MDSAQTFIWDHAFCFRLLTVHKFHETTKLLSKVKFDGRSKIDDLGHLYKFNEKYLSLKIFDQGSLCIFFIGTFKGQIMKWFDATTTGSIHSWEKFVQSFVNAHQSYDYD
jgi:hypothetical protein